MEPLAAVAVLVVTSLKQTFIYPQRHTLFASVPAVQERKQEQHSEPAEQTVTDHL